MGDHSRKINWIKRNKEKHAAHSTVYRAIKRGELKRLPCFCGNIKVHAHHEDYSKPLEVEFLCSKHHKERHKRRLTQ